MSLAGCQINLIDVNFHLQKSLEIFDKNSADKIWSKKDKEIKVSPLMPIRVHERNIAGLAQLLGSKISVLVFLIISYPDKISEQLVCPPRPPIL